MNKFRLHPLYEIDGVIGAESGVEETQVAAEQTETPVIESGAEKEVAAEPNNFEKAFAKRLAAKEAEWESKNSEKYKDYELHKEMSEYLSELNGDVDLLTLKERRELERLQDRAEKENVPPEVLKRIDQLEAEAAEGKELKQKQQENERIATFHTTLAKFVEGKGVEPEALSQFMVENELQYNPNNMEKSFDIALKAFKADQIEADKAAFEANKEQFKKDTLKEYLESKKAPKAEGKGAAGVLGQGAPGSWKNADQRALERIRSANSQV